MPFVCKFIKALALNVDATRRSLCIVWGMLEYLGASKTSILFFLSNPKESECHMLHLQNAFDSACYTGNALQSCSQEPQHFGPLGIFSHFYSVFDLARGS